MVILKVPPFIKGMNIKMRFKEIQLSLIRPSGSLIWEAPAQNRYNFTTTDYKDEETNSPLLPGSKCPPKEEQTHFRQPLSIPATNSQPES